MSLTLNDEIIEKYFGFLVKFDNTTKKKLIRKLETSLAVSNTKTVDIDSLYGAWEDSKSSDEIIKEIRDSRVNKRDIPEFL